MAAYCTQQQKSYLAVSTELQKATVGDTKPLIILSSLLPGDLFTDKALVVSCKLGNKGEIKTCSLLDIGATGIEFIDEKMPRYVCHVLKILFLPLAKPKLLKEFDEKPAKPIMYAIYSMLTVQSHSKLLVFMLVILLSQYPIILGKPWMQKHGIILDMSCNKLTFWPGHCKHSKIRKLLVPSAKEPHAKPHAERHAPTLKSIEPTLATAIKTT